MIKSVLSLPRSVLLPALLLLTIWATQLRYPILSYPAIGQILVILLSGWLVLFNLKKPSLKSSGYLRSHPAWIPGILFLLWVIIRWILTGLNARGGEEVGTILWFSIYAMAGYSLISVARSRFQQGNGISLFFLFGIAFTGLLCSLHAIWQYHVSYGETYKQLLNSIGSREPTFTELGLLDHLQRRRVAGVFGDANNLATFCALAYCAALEIISRKSVPLRIAATLSIIPMLIALYYTGSRGGVLDIIFASVLYGILLVKNAANRPAPSSVVATGALLIGLCFCPIPDSTAQVAAEPASRENPTGSWQWRSNTVQERMYYLEVGVKMIQKSPLTGLGPGSVEQYFGRLKDPAARETKYLHNWVVQTAAEYGLIGIFLVAAFFATVLYISLKTRSAFVPATRSFNIMVLILLFDALIQVTWNQRELMSTFGLITGILMAQSRTPLPDSPSRSPVFLKVAGGFIFLIFIATQMAFLGNQNAKLTAEDFSYAGDFTSAKKYWRRALQWIPNDSRSYGALASIAEASGQLSQARIYITKALQNNPDSPSLHIQAMSIAQKLRKETEADKHLTAALSLYPSQPENNYIKAVTLAKDNRTTEALTYAKRALQYNVYDQSADKYQNLISTLSKTIND